MDTPQIKYNGEFTVEERKIMTAKAIQELRKAKKMSQKEVAGALNIPATTYNTYESGRTEPPIEILVRLSHLYGMPIDLIVQRDRTYRTADDVSREMEKAKQQLAEIDKLIEDSGANDPAIVALRATLEKFADAMISYSQTEAAQKLNIKDNK